MIVAPSFWEVGSSKRVSGWQQVRSPPFSNSLIKMVAVAVVVPWLLLPRNQKIEQHGSRCGALVALPLSSVTVQAPLQYQRVSVVAPLLMLMAFHKCKVQSCSFKAWRFSFSALFLGKGGDERSMATSQMEQLVHGALHSLLAITNKRTKHFRQQRRECQFFPHDVGEAWQQIQLQQKKNSSKINSNRISSITMTSTTNRRNKGYNQINKAFVTNCSSAIERNKVCSTTSFS